MKLTRNELKSVVKECLLEILSEGMGSTVSSDINEAAKKKTAASRGSVPHVSSMMRQNASKTRIQSQALKEAIKIESGGNDVMAAILADTAEKSLPTMIESDRPGVARLPTMGAAENIVASVDPDVLFGEEASSKWANLAFSASPKK